MKQLENLPKEKQIEEKQKNISTGPQQKESKESFEFENIKEPKEEIKWKQNKKNEFDNLNSDKKEEAKNEEFNEKKEQFKNEKQEQKMNNETDVEASISNVVIDALNEAYKIKDKQPLTENENALLKKYGALTEKKYPQIAQAGGYPEIVFGGAILMTFLKRTDRFKKGKKEDKKTSAKHMNAFDEQ